MSDEKKTPKLNEEVKKRDADKHNSTANYIIRVIDGKRVKIDIKDL